LGVLHERNLTPHRAIWTLATISAIFGCVTVVMYFGNGSAPADSAIAALPHSFLTVTLASNFGTFLLYGLSCITCLVCFHNHPKFKVVRHLIIPVFGLLANLACMAFYLIGPFMGYGTKMEPLIALGIALAWGACG